MWYDNLHLGVILPLCNMCRFHNLHQTFPPHEHSITWHQHTRRPVKHSLAGTWWRNFLPHPGVQTYESKSYSCHAGTHWFCNTLSAVAQLLRVHDQDQSCDQNSLKQQRVNTSETLEARNKLGSRENKRGGGRGGQSIRGRVFLGIPYVANKQAETPGQRHRKTTGQWGGLCSSGKVVWETLRPGWEVFSRETEGERDIFISLLSRVKKLFNNVLFTPSSERMREGRGLKRERCKAERQKVEGSKWRSAPKLDRAEDTEHNICFLITNHPIIITMRKWQPSQKPAQQFWLALLI